MKPSRIILLLVALLAGGLAFYLATRGGDAPVQEAASPQVVQESKTQILVAAVPIGVGQRLLEGTVQWTDWPASQLRPEYITIAAAPDALVKMQGAVARFEFFPGEPIREQKLAHSDQGYLSAVLAEGKRGVSIAVNANSASGGFIVPNDHVDVVQTRAGEGGQLSTTILSNVKVLAIGTRLGETGATGAPADPNSTKAETFADQSIATLELTPDQGETLISAAAGGPLSLALRSIVDFNETQNAAPRRAASQPIRMIRFGQASNITSGAATTAAAGTIPVSPAALVPQVSLTPSPAADLALPQVKEPQ